MAKVAVCLVGDQAIPNVLFLKEFGPFDKLLFISTRSMEKKGKVRATTEAAELKQNVEGSWKTIEVLEDDMTDIQTKIGESIRSWKNEEHDIHVNLTGGNKIMSLATFEFFSSYGGRIYYLPIGKNQAFIVFPGVLSGRKYPINARLHVENYFIAHSIKPRIHGADLRLIEMSLGVIDRFSHNGAFRSGLKEVSGQLRNYRGEKAIRLELSLRKKLDALDLFRGQPGLARGEIQFLTGGWLELAVYRSVQSILNDSLGFVVPSMHMVSGVSGVDNELDVVAVVNNSLITFECKTSLMDKEHSFFNETIYKMQSLRKELGLACKAVLVTCDESLLDGKKREEKASRAKMFDIDLVTSEDMISSESLQSRFREIMKIN